MRYHSRLSFMLLAVALFGVTACSKKPEISDPADAARLIFPSTSTPEQRANVLTQGEKVFNRTCIMCHGAGNMGAPALEDKAHWAPRIAKLNRVDVSDEEKAKLVDGLANHVIYGYKGKSGEMPEMGGCVTCSEADVQAAVRYVLAQVLYNQDA